MLEDLGCQKNIDVIRKFVDLGDKFVLDVGCGDLSFSRQLRTLGARVLAIDPDPIQSEKNRQLAEEERLEFVEASGECLPADDHSVDGIFFSYSLHHIPYPLYNAVFGEVFRTLKRDGFVYVIEPMDCPLNQVMKLFHDEDLEREQAQEALKTIVTPAFDHVSRVTYHSISAYDSFDQFADHFSSRSFNSNYTENDVRAPEVQAAFQKHGGDLHRFVSPKMVHVFQGLR